MSGRCIEPMKSSLAENSCSTGVFSKVQRQWWRVIGCLVVFWFTGVFFRQYNPFSIGRSHEVREVDLEFERRVADGESSPFDANGFLGSLKASRYCNAHNFKPFPKRDSRRKLYDLVMVNTELDWLEIRLNELHKHVDYFVVLESATSFTGRPKTLAVKENWSRFKKFDKQIIYHLLEDAPVSSNYYSFQWLHRGQEWPHPQATTYHGNDTVLPATLRKGAHGINRFKNLDESADLWNAAWHCSSCFSTIEEMLTKMSSFSHVELNKPEFRNKKTIADRVRGGKDLWMRWGQNYDRVDNNEDIPRHMKQNKEKFEYMLDRDNENAGFVDYKP